jgi:predicted nuclease with TOPRIM domain
VDNTQRREEGFSKMENSELQARVKELEYDCAELEKSNSELTDRVKKLANRMPAWPKGYRPQNRKFKL